MGNCCKPSAKRVPDPGNTTVHTTKPDDSKPIQSPGGRYDPDPAVILKLQIERLIQGGRKVVKALYDYNAPRDDDAANSDLNLKVNDVLEVLDEESEWWYARNIRTNQQGYIPSTFVAPYDSIQQNEWYHGDIDRKEAEKRLLAPGHINGTFLVRTSKPTDPAVKIGYALSVLTVVQPQPSVDDRRASRPKSTPNAAKTDVRTVRHFRIRCLSDGRCLLSPKLVEPSLEKLVELYIVDSSGENRARTDAPLLVRPCAKGKPVIYDVSHSTCDQWQIDRNALQFVCQIGAGQFGEVWKGKWLGHDVAIKSLTPGSMKAETFLAEATVMKRLRHQCLIALYAVCLDAEPFYIVTEFLPNGDLLGYLRRARDATNPDERLSSRQLIDIAGQIAEGMAYIHRQGIIHRDLAARNVLVADNNCVKICDFGLARPVDSNVQFEETKFPIKWTAPEAIRERRFTFKSDVWSFGIVLVELFTLGDMPYKGMVGKELQEKLANGYRHPKPPDCPPEVYDTMLYCWKARPEERPTFDHLEDRLANLEEIDPGYQETQ